MVVKVVDDTRLTEGMQTLNDSGGVDNVAFTDMAR